VQAIIEGLVEEAFPGRVVNYLGATSQKKRQAAVDRFQDDEGCIFFNASLGAAATGITLTAGWRVRFPEFDWRPDFLVQAEDRAWRIGQEKGVDVGYFAIANTLDARMGRGIMLKMEGMERATGPLDLTARVRAVGPKSGARDPESPSLDRRQPAELFEMA
jgi:SNF2 family DNA or RNA helicase